MSEEKKLKVTDMFIKSNEVRYITGNKIVGRPALPEIKGIPAQPEEKNKEGVVIKKAVPEKKGQEAQPAKPAEQQMWIFSASTKIAAEVEARMAAEGIFPTTNVEPINYLEKNAIFRGFDASKKIGICYSAPDRQKFQDALKKVKSREHYNKLGFEIQKADKAEKARKKAAEQKEKEKKAAEKTGEKTDTKQAMKPVAKKLGKLGMKKPE